MPVAGVYINKHAGIPCPLLHGATEELVKQYLNRYSPDDGATWDLDVSKKTATMHISNNDVKLRLKELTDGRLTASLEDGNKMKFEPVDYRNSAAGNGSEPLTDFW